MGISVLYFFLYKVVWFDAVFTYYLVTYPFEFKDVQVEVAEHLEVGVHEDCSNTQPTHPV